MKGLIALACLLLAGAAHATEWHMDARTSRLVFMVSYEGTTAPGTFGKFDVRLRFDPERLAASRLDVTVALASADLNSADINRAIKRRPWFDVAHHPRAEFHATDFRRTGSHRYVARGTLRLKGREHPVTVPFSWTVHGDTAKMEGELSIDRAKFDLGTGEWAATDVIGAKVGVRFEVGLSADDPAA
jgi:polyisoprenoid-binding protein YceI